MQSAEKFAKRVFQIAGWYGIVVIVPQYFLEARIGLDTPPPISHPEYFYGFTGVTLAFQFAFLLIASNPVQYLKLIPVAMFEKISFVVAAIALYSFGRLQGPILGGAFIDAILFVVFTISYRRLSRGE
jgi:hypothetical protein